ncbi:MAG: hypothetical protein ABH879_10845 [archaeon]
MPHIYDKSFTFDKKQIEIDYNIPHEFDDEVVRDYALICKEFKVPPATINATSFNENLGTLCRVITLAFQEMLRQHHESFLDYTSISITFDRDMVKDAKYITFFSSPSHIEISVSVIRFLGQVTYLRYRNRQVRIKTILAEYYNIIQHEFTHHLDLDYLDMALHIGFRYSDLKDKELLGNNAWFIFMMFSIIRQESATLLQDGYIKFGYFRIDTSKFEELSRICESSIKDINCSRPLDLKVCYNIGFSLGNIIGLYILATEGKRQFLLIKGDSDQRYDIGKLRKFYGKQRFDVYYGAYPTFVKEHDPHFLSRIIDRIHELDHIQLLEAYEISCKKLKIKPLIKAKTYKRYMTRCYTEYQKRLEKR